MPTSSAASLVCPKHVFVNRRVMLLRAMSELTMSHRALALGSSVASDRMLSQRSKKCGNGP